jgi:hypothetical protein
MSEPFVLSKPLLVLFEQDGNLVCHLWPREKDTYQGYGLMIADLVRHAANAFHVSEDDVFEWVEKEMRYPTTRIMRPS